MSDLLVVERVNKRYGGIRANHEISLAVLEGGIAGLIGPNGSGKSTLFHSIAGAHPIDSGQIRFAGRDITALRTAAIARLGLVRTFQQTRIYRQMTCLANMHISVPQAELGLAGLLRPVPPADRERAEELLAFCGLHAKRHLIAGTLSFGQQKLLELAMALMNEPRMLLLDEPTAGINPTLINGLIERLKRVNADLGITLFVIEHNMRVIMNLADHIFCLAHGEMLASGTPDAVRADRRVLEAYLGAA
jgi:branched-chain amino acid transport system ATP-binding protein